MGFFQHFFLFVCLFLGKVYCFVLVFVFCFCYCTILTSSSFCPGGAMSPFSVFYTSFEIIKSRRYQGVYSEGLECWNKTWSLSISCSSLLAHRTSSNFSPLTCECYHTAKSQKLETFCPCKASRCILNWQVECKDFVPDCSWKYSGFWDLNRECLLGPLCVEECWTEAYALLLLPKPIRVVFSFQAEKEAVSFSCM